MNPLSGKPLRYLPLEKPEGDGEPCYYCGEPCDAFAGNAALWPLGFCQADGTGICRWHHSGCVVERLPPRKLPTLRDLLDAVDFLFAEKQGHCPSELYEDGYSDACADAKAAIRRLYP